MKFKLLINWKLKVHLITLLLLSCFDVTHGQTAQTITGKVSDEGGVLPGVSVLVKGTTTGTITNFDGVYQIKAKDTDVLVFSFLGYGKKEIKVAGKKQINVVLDSDVTNLKDVVVIGYGTQKKKEVTGSVGQIQAEDLIKNSTSDLGQALQGQITGVNVTASSGEPGAESNISIRGLNSITGFNGPLYIVDGIPQDGNPNLSNNEIETIDVLKDAASAAIYGTRGSGGVILITTKKGKEGKMKIKLDSYYGVQNIYSEIPKANFEEDLYIRLMKLQTLNGTTFNNSFTPLEQNVSQFTNDTDLSKRLLIDNAPIQNHSLNVSGGAKGATYSVVGTFFNQEGSVINSGYDRFNIRANSQLSSGKWTVTTGFGARVDNRQFSTGQLLTSLYTYHPYQADLIPGAPVIEDATQQISDQNTTTTLNAYINRKDNNKGTNFTGNMTIDFELTKNLKLTSRTGIGYTNNNRIRINPSFKLFDVDGNSIPSQIRTGVYNYTSSASNYSIENIITYKKSFGKHNFNLLGVYSAEEYKFQSFSAEKFDLFNNDVTVLDGAISEDRLISSGANDKTNTLTGALARLQYNYKGKYLLSLSARRDGSSRFGSANRFQTFPSVSMGWNISDEDFWKPYKDIANSFKMRASYGTTGNQGIADYSYANTITLQQDYVLGGGSSNVLVNGATQTGFGNPDVKWETSIQKNIGFDLAFLKNRLTLTTDLYETNKKDLLLPVLLPNSTGGAANNGDNGTIVQNIGDMRNIGIEYALNYKSKGKNFNWNTALTYSRNQNRITKLNDGVTISYLANSVVVQGVPNEDLVSAIALGHEAGSFFLIKTNGIIKTQAELDAYNAEFPGIGANLGDLRLVDNLTVDTNGDGIPDKGDGVIDSRTDRQYAGSGTPDFELGWNFNAYYKNFDFSMQWYGSFGAEVINGSKAAGYKYETHKDLVFAWSPQNTDTNIPTNRGRDYINFRGYTDYWLEDGTFARLKNIAVGYSLPKSLLKKMTVSKLRVYLAAQNIITLTKYSGFDPEVGNNGLSTRGIDRGNYPITSQLRAGLQLDF
ncbi:TonB-dependent receptor [Flavobacterium sp. NG2]|uniref:SusC/RagA family TonB-linked outer membrane protein n=1 Tax=Flavobacterium sp. NG2 TaxID=3097547 RepID=UPI002A83DDE0|nr:TonB-dependent receptor [Flavobacterium sp. NG2]WPR71083.1 TonB-dependent receptor [Flavobacterium sp. NG2]